MRVGGEGAPGRGVAVRRPAWAGRYPGAVVEVEDQPGQGAVHPGQDVGAGLVCHLAVGEEEGAAGPLPPQVLGMLGGVRVGQAEHQGPADTPPPSLLWEQEQKGPQAPAGAWRQGVLRAGGLVYRPRMGLRGHLGVHGTGSPVLRSPAPISLLPPPRVAGGPGKVLPGPRELAQGPGLWLWARPEGEGTPGTPPTSPEDVMAPLPSGPLRCGHTSPVLLCHLLARGTQEAVV